jgi:RNA polymerase sigma factor (sigma-70 family)
MIRPVACFTRLLRMCRARGRSLEDSEDLIQEALLRLEEYRRKAEVADKEEFLARTVRNLAIDQFRHEQIIVYAEEPIEEIAERLSLADPAPTPEGVVDSWQRLDEIKKRLETVSVRAQQMYFYSMTGYKHREIAKIFGVSVPTVERELMKALMALMKE